MDEMPEARYPMLLTSAPAGARLLVGEAPQCRDLGTPCNRNLFIDRPGWADEFLSHLSS